VLALDRYADFDSQVLLPHQLSLDVCKFCAVTCHNTHL
jgi:hypothetical protein